jgi:hypothetical protein
MGGPVTPEIVVLQQADFYALQIAPAPPPVRRG